MKYQRHAMFTKAHDLSKRKSKNELSERIEFNASGAEIIASGA